MTIRPGDDWGDRSEIPSDAVFVDSDAEASLVINEARRASRELPKLYVRGGDLARTLGSSGDRSGGDSAIGTHVRIDLGAALVDGRLHWFISHLVARKSWLRGRVVVAANAAFIGTWNIAPRAHPGDGRLDLLDANPSLSDRLKARSRLASGTHLPHPKISVRRIAAAQIDFERDTPVYLDGREVGTARSLSLRVEPHAVDVWV